MFTPAKLPTVTDVDRSQTSAALRKWVRRGGYFVSVLGTTKLGKPTLVKGLLRDLQPAAWTTYLPGQSLQGGETDLWSHLVKALGIPTSTETGRASSKKSTWGVFSKLALSWLPGNSAEAGGNAGGESGSESSSSELYDLDPQAAVSEALLALRRGGMDVVIAIDDFHFVTSPETRRNLLLALRPLTDEGCSVVLSTIPGRESDEGFGNTNLGGRRKSVKVPRWDEDELKQIAGKGFPALSVVAEPGDIDRLAAESFGSPQIMQQLCLDLCEEVNGVTEGESGQMLAELKAPADWDEFFKQLEDDDASGWVSKLAAGPNPRKKRNRRLHPGPPPRELDGYQLILQALHSLGAPEEVGVDRIKALLGDQLHLSGAEVNGLRLETKIRNMGEIAARETTRALEDAMSVTARYEVNPDPETDDDDGELSSVITEQAIPQPVFEHVDGVVRILDPLVSYMLKWHPEILVKSGRV